MSTEINKAGYRRITVVNDSLTPEQRAESARRAAKARWSALTPEERSQWRYNRDKKSTINQPEKEDK